MPAPKRLMILSLLLGFMALGGYSSGPQSLTRTACAASSCDPSVPNCCSCVTCSQDADGDGFCVGASAPKCGVACPAGWRVSSSCAAASDCNDSDPSVHHPAAQTCPTACHTDTQYVPDGSCGLTTCSSNAPAAQTCPTSCHNGTVYVPDGSCGSSSCAPNAPAAQSCPTSCHSGTVYVPNGSCGSTVCTSNAPAYQACPTTCGYGGGYLSDGNCGTHYCSATSACVSCPSNTPGIWGWNNDGYATVGVNDYNTCNGVSTTYHYYQYTPDFQGPTYLGGWTTSNTSNGLYLGNMYTPCGCHYRFSSGLSPYSGGPSWSDVYTGTVCLWSGCYP